MRHLLLSSSSITMAHSSPSLSKSPTTTTTTAAAATTKPSNPNPNPNHSLNGNFPSSLLCRHSPSATFDALIFILVIISGTFLISSYFSYIFHSLSLVLPSLFLLLSHSTTLIDSPILYILGFLTFFLLAIIASEICCGYRSRRCGKPGCKGMKAAMEFDLQLQTEECLRSAAKAVREIDGLPWKGGSEGNPDYECLRAELRKMAPPNGRAVLLFRAKCGCPIGKLEGWGPKRGRRNKKSLALNGGGDHR